jgi:tetratricopeptide (TPR) repeat protein
MRVSPGWTILLFASVCIVYIQALGNGFHYDDFHSLVNNPHIGTLNNIPGFFVDPTLFSLDEKQAMYRPVLLASYAMNYALFGGTPQGFHLFNVLLHAANVVLLLYLATALGFASLAAWTAAIVFAFHPIAVETVHYVSSRSEGLMAFGILASLCAYMRWKVGHRRLFYIASLLAFSVALLSKSVGIVLLVLIPLCDWLQMGWSQKGSRWRVYAPYWAVAAVYLLVSRSLVSKALFTPVRPLDIQFWTQIKAWVYYILMGAMPMRLSVEHQFFASPTVFDPVVVGALLLIVSALGAVFGYRQRQPLFALLWSAVVLLPASVVPLIVLVNEHRLYLSLAGMGLLLGWLLNRLYQRMPRVALSSFAVYTILLALAAFSRGKVWADERHLWADAAEKAPLMLKPHLRWADALSAAGELAAAEKAYLHALHLRPHHPAVRNNLGRLYMQQGRIEEAEIQFRALLEVSADIVPARLNMAALLLRKGAWDEAEKQYLQALQYGDTAGDAQGKLGYIALKYHGDVTGALRYYEQALELRSDASIRVAYGVALRAAGRYEESEAAYKKALVIDVTWADAWYNLANLYRDTGQLRQALDAYKRVVDLAAAPLDKRAIEQIQLLTP